MYYRWFFEIQRVWKRICRMIFTPKWPTALQPERCWTCCIKICWENRDSRFCFWIEQSLLHPRYPVDRILRREALYPAKLLRHIMYYRWFWNSTHLGTNVWKAFHNEVTDCFATGTMVKLLHQNLLGKSRSPVLLLIRAITSAPKVSGWPNS